MKLTADWVQHGGTQSIFGMLEGSGHQAFFVGGCVRNGLLSRHVDDIDLSTDALPEQVMDLANAQGLRAVPTGIDHGTVTVIAEGKPHEITTFRRDVETDGRRATVAYSKTLAEDAARRDFTMNALYAARLGQIIDPTGQGVSDLTARRLRFIGDPEARIREDYLRILRFFRFHAWYADPTGGLDPEGLAACAALADGIETLSKERLGSEMRKLLSAPDPGPAIAAMAVSGVLGRVLPGAVPDFLWPLVALEAEQVLAPEPIRRLATLGGEGVGDALRLSKADAARLDLLRTGMASPDPAAVLGYLVGPANAQDILLLRAAQLGMPPDPHSADEIARGASAVFPVAAADLMPAMQGPALGQRLKMLEARWIASDFTLDKAALLAIETP